MWSNYPRCDDPEINMEGRKIQEKCHGPNHFIPFHYVEILNNKGTYSFLGRDQAKRQSVIDLLNQFIKNNKFKIISCFIDKQQLALQYGVFMNKKLFEIRKIKPNVYQPATPKKINLYEISLKHILTEYYKYLSERKKRGLIIAEGRGKVEDRNLLNAFYRFQRLGVGSLSGKELRSYVVDLLVIYKSQNHLGTQLADLITYPLYDYKIPNHNIRNDHFIRPETFKDKIIKIKVFP